MISRRQFFWTAGAGTAAVAAASLLPLRAPASESNHGSERFEIEYSDSEWRARLTPQQYAVLRQEDTERPFTSPLDREKRAGTFSCAGCSLPLFSSQTKFDSGTGWPSFWQPLEGAVGERTDNRYGMRRVEVHCRRCGGHLGHVFNDGPAPTGLRYCMNGLAMQFTPA